jgi:multicomponent Na+:H+ antiporter subunit D
MTVTADVFNLYVFLEIAGLAAYALVATRAGGPAALAALRYLLAGTVGATFYLLGVGYLYVATGTLAMADLAPALAAVGHDSPTVVAAFVLVVVGLGTKVALFPVHAWKPDAYASAPADVAALLAAVGSTVPGYALVRVVFDVFTVDFLVAVPAARALLVGGGLVSVLAGGYLTLRQSEGRRLLAYSSVLQFGLVVVGLGVATTAAVTAAVLLLLANGVAKAGLFVAAGRLEAAAGPAVGDWAGLARDRPVLGVAVAVAFASLVGLPPTVGFAGKWYLALAAVDASRPVAAAVVLASTLVSLAYAGRVVEHLYFGTATADGTRAATDGGRPVEDEEPVGDPGDDAVRGGRHPAGTGRALDRRATAVVALAAAGTLALGLGSTAVADWVAPVVGAWLEGSA